MDNTYLKRVLDFYKKANIVLTDKEKQQIEFVDFNLGDFENTGLSILTYVNTERCCAKEMVLLPYQTCPEHLHPDIDGVAGKEETFRCRYGTVYLFVQGQRTLTDVCPPQGVYSVFHQIKLEPGEQYTLSPNTKHWFKAGQFGAVISEFSTKSVDQKDVFTDENIKRVLSDDY